MRGRKIVASILVVVLLLGAGASVALAQQGGRGGRGERGERGGRSNWDPAQMQQRYMERMKETLKVGDEEWKVLQPRIEKVTTLSREVRGGGMRLMMGAGRGRPGAEGQRNVAPQPQSAMQKAHLALQTILEDEAATAEDIKAKLTALRTAREKAKQELATAQQSLRELLTQRQEAQFVLMGILD